VNTYKTRDSKIMENELLYKGPFISFNNDMNIQKEVISHLEMVAQDVVPDC